MPQMRQPSLDVLEHAENARAKRALMIGLEDAGGDYLAPSIKDFPAKGRSALEVILVDTDGDLYNASSGGGGATGHNLVNVVTGATLFNIANVITLPTVHSVSGIVTSATLFNVAGVISLPTVHAMSGVVTSATTHSVVGVNKISEAVGDQIRVRTFYVDPVGGAGAPTDIPSINNLWGGVSIFSPSTNATQIYIGAADVTAFRADLAVGFILEPGDSISLPIDSTDDVFAVADGTVTLLLSMVGIIK